MTAPADPTPITGRFDPKLAGLDRFMAAFVVDHQVPGAALAVGRRGKIVYARGFGYADVAGKVAVEPGALFRIASISKPFTAAAILQLQERGKLRLDEKAFAFVGLQPFLAGGAKVDPRLGQVTIRELLHHTGGFDRERSFDPMFRSVQIANDLGVAPPAGPTGVIRFMLGRPLDFDPGTKMAYSNFGYCVLGRVIEKASGVPYGEYVSREVLAPLGIRRMRLGRTLEADRAPGEVRYYPRNDKTVASVFGDGKQLPLAYAGWYLEAMDSHGGWIASAPELVRFASALDDPEHCPILKAAALRELVAPPGFRADNPAKSPYYACGWRVRPVADGKFNAWHTGRLDGTSTLLVRRFDGFTWAVLFNTDSDANNKGLAAMIDPMLHAAIDGIKAWPEGRDFEEEEP